MKKFFVPFLLVILGLFAIANAQTEYEFDCPILSLEKGEGEAASQTGGRYKPVNSFWQLNSFVKNYLIPLPL